MHINWIGITKSNKGNDVLYISLQKTQTKNTLHYGKGAIQRLEQIGAKQEDIDFAIYLDSKCQINYKK